MVVTGDLLTLLSWERKLPVEMMSGQLEVKLALAWSFILVTRFAEGTALLAQVEEAADEERTPDLWWRCQATRGVLAAMSDDSGRALALGTACQGKTRFDPFYRNALWNVLRFGRWKSASFDDFYALPKPDSSDGEGTYVLAEQYRLCLYGMVAAQRLHTSEALSRYAEARQLIEKYAGSRSAAAAIPTGLSAILRYEAGDVRGAEIAVLDELDLIETTVFHESFLSAHLVLARAAHVRDDPNRALKVLERGRQLARERGWDRLVAAFLLEQARFIAGDASPAELQHIVEDIKGIQRNRPSPGRCSWSDIEIAAVACEGVAALAACQPVVAAQRLQLAYEAMLLVDDRYGALRVGMDLALARYRAGDLTEANRIASRVVSSAAPAGAVSFVLERAAQAIPLLTACLKSAAEPHARRYTEQLLSGCRERIARPADATKQLLTDREQSIVQFIAGGQSNKQIARTIGVTPETVKTHVKRIFVKLSAESRTQAVVRAQSLGLLRNIELN
jgi:LuxR family maltose regulon positive regulatory protein